MEAYKAIRTMLQEPGMSVQEYLTKAGIMIKASEDHNPLWSAMHSMSNYATIIDGLRSTRLRAKCYEMFESWKCHRECFAFITEWHTKFQAAGLIRQESTVNQIDKSEDVYYSDEEED